MKQLRIPIAIAGGLLMLCDSLIAQGTGSAQGTGWKATDSVFDRKSRKADERVADRRMDDRPQMYSDQPRNGVPPTMHQPNGIAPASAYGMQPRTIRDYSWTYIDPAPEPRKLKVHDIVVIIVDEKSEVTENALYNRQKTGQLKLELKDFVRIDDDGNAANAAANSPTVDTNLQQNLQSRGIMLNREGMKFRIAATVSDILPNGNVVLESRKSVRSNWNVWTYSLTGIARPEDVLANNTILSENIYNLDIDKTEKGKIRDASRRGWLATTYDFLSPF